MGDDTLTSALQRMSLITRWVDIEQELASFARENSGSDTLQEEYLHLKSALCDYIASIEVPKDIESAHAHKLINQVSGDEGLYVVNFNYTNSVKHLLSKAGLDDSSISKRLLHIHGSIESKDIIFGVDDSSHVPDQHVYLNKSYAKNFADRDLINRLQAASKVHFFGHSLGAPDRAYFIQFFGRLAATHVQTKVYFYHYGEQGLKDLMVQLRSITGNRVSAVRSNAEVSIIDVSK